MDQGLKNSGSDRQENALFEVTIFSKYFSMVLFIVVPFLAGYIGYLHAPERVVENIVIRDIVEDNIKIRETPVYLHVREPFLLDVNDTTPVKDLEYFTDLFFDTVLEPRLRLGTDLAFLYYSSNSQRLYFRTAPHSSVSLQIYAFDIFSNTFAETDIYIDHIDGGSFSENGRYVLPEMSPGAFNVIDLFDLSIVAEVILPENESFISGVCGYGGAEFPQVEWVDDGLVYQVFDAATVETADCYDEQPVLIEERTVTFRES